MIRYFVNTAFVVFMTAIMISCNNDNTLVVETAPSISMVRTSSYWNINGSHYYVEVVAQDPQGFDNIETVTLSIRNSNAQIPPMAESGMAVKIKAACDTELKVKNKNKTSTMTGIGQRTRQLTDTRHDKTKDETKKGQCSEKEASKKRTETRTGR